MQLSQEEQRVVALFAAMPPSSKVRFPTWFVELIVPLALAIGGWVTGHPVFVGAAFSALLPSAYVDLLPLKDSAARDHYPAPRGSLSAAVAAG